MQTEAASKEITELEEMKVIKVHHYSAAIPKEFQWAPLVWIFNLKKEGMYIKERLAAGNDVVDECAPA